MGIYEELLTEITCDGPWCHESEIYYDMVREEAFADAQDDGWCSGDAGIYCSRACLEKAEGKPSQHKPGDVGDE